MRRPTAFFTSLLLSAALIGGSALAQSGAGPSRAAPQNTAQVCSPRDSQGQPCPPNAQPGQGRATPAQASPTRNAPAQPQRQAAPVTPARTSQVPSAQVSRVDVYLDGREVLDNVTRQQAARLRVGPGNHRIVVVPHGQPLTGVVAARTFRAQAATTLQLSFGDGFSLSLR